MRFSWPWISMWTEPRRTIRCIVDTDPDRHVLFLTAIAGIGRALDNASLQSVGDQITPGAILLLAAIAGPIGSIISLYVSAALLRWTGSWIGGQAGTREIRSAIAWAGVIAIWGMTLWVPEFLLFGKEIFMAETPLLNASTSLTALSAMFSIGKIILGVWMTVAFLKCLAEVQGFSDWKALGNSLLVGLVLLGPIMGIIGLAKMLQ